MIFIVDECTGDRVVQWLRTKGFDVYSVYKENKGADDEWILWKAAKEKYVVITNDKDFGELIFKEGKGHCGVIFLRLKNESFQSKTSTIEQVIERCYEKLPVSFIVASEDYVRISRS